MRLDELFAYPAERTEFTDEFYAALGRAAAFCTHFEANCKSLAGLLGLKNRVLSGESSTDVIDAVLREFERKRLKQHIDYLEKSFGLSITAAEMLRSAREARNIVAHEVALGVPRAIESNSGRQNVLDELGPLVREVARADLLVCLLSQLVERDDLPPAKFRDEYPDRIKRWILEVEG